MPSMDLKYATLKIKDGGSETITVVWGDGNLTWTETFNRIYDKDRGLLDNVRNGDQEPLSVNFDGRWEYLKASSGSGVPSIRDALLKEGEAAAWVTTDSDTCAPYAVDLEFEYTPPCTADDIETVTFPDFRVETINPDAKSAQIAVVGKCNVVSPTIVRTPQ